VLAVVTGTNAFVLLGLIVGVALGAINDRLT
jgi:hypothetical protein